MLCMYRHKNYLAMVRKRSCLDVADTFFGYYKHSWSRLENIRQCHTHESQNTVSNCGHWLTNPSTATPPKKENVRS